jgi:hypothetical protein
VWSYEVVFDVSGVLNSSCKADMFTSSGKLNIGCLNSNRCFVRRVRSLDKYIVNAKVGKYVAFSSFLKLPTT